MCVRSWGTMPAFLRHWMNGISRPKSACTVRDDYVLRDYMLAAFKPMMPKGRALEMGCYHGEFTKKLSAVFKDLTVIEGASDHITIAKKNAPKATFIHSAFEDAKFDKPFDAIFLMHTLEHLDDPVGILKLVNTWLSPKGKLFLVVPNAYAPSRQIAVKMGLIKHPEAVTQGEREHGHRITYSMKTLKRDAKAGGFSILKEGGIFFKPFANYQFDKLMKTDIISKAYLDGCYALGEEYPELCASIYLVCGKGKRR
ncbi:MAG: class I SAM-dependent methyltransferase [Proteobacteria bacterium]|nr:class I SAM-dependent methyltransferase [Pseudomonadota bacterium]